MLLLDRIGSKVNFFLRGIKWVELIPWIVASPLIVMLLIYMNCLPVILQKNTAMYAEDLRDLEY